jgi:recombination associated protein RdgC
MWFKNVQLYRFNAPFNLTAEEFEAQLSKDPLTPCPAAAFSNSGWLPPGHPESEMMVRVIHHHLLFCLGTQDKIMPPAVIRERVKEETLQIEHAEGRTLNRSEKMRLTEKHVAEMLPKAFIRKNQIFALLNLKEGWLIVDQSNPNKAETFTERLRNTLGTLPVAPVQVADSPAHTLTQWLSNNPPKNIELQHSCELVDPSDVAAVVRIRGVDLTQSEVQHHLDSGKRVSKLQITWNEQLTCEISDAFEFRKLRFEGMIKEEADAHGSETALEKMDAELAIMGPLLEAFLLEMIDQFGGLST